MRQLILSMSLAFVVAGCSADCPSPQVKCGTLCIDVRIDPSNCGLCGVTCKSGEICSAGKCGVPCPTGQSACGSTCADLTSDAKHCGDCATSCPSLMACSGGKCTSSCPAGEMACNGSCRNLQIDPQACGDCGTQCMGGLVCLSGKCGCPSGLTACGGNCFNTLSDGQHCGSCATVCPTGTVCSNGSCGASCASNETNCAGSCANTQLDPSHCGSCTTVCASGQTCNSGQCGIVCPTGQMACSGKCFDLQTETTHCGDCGTACGVGKQCVAGQCSASCATPLMACSGACVDTRFDPTNCGMCGKACSTVANGSAGCANGTCAVGGCNTGYRDCNGSVTDGCEANLSSDNANCGGCGINCNALPNSTGSCNGSGKCSTVCNTGYKHCSSNPTDGCEVNVTSDANNCGACGTKCPSGACFNGNCSAHGTATFVGGNGPSTQCGYAGSGAYKWDNLGPMTWKQCIVEASKRAAMLVPNIYTTAGWSAHRINGSASYFNPSTGSWPTLYLQGISNTYPCIVGRSTSSSYSMAPLSNTITFDSNTWHYQDYGPQPYDQCEALATQSGSMIITPYTIGQQIDGYWSQTQHSCNTMEYINSSGSGFGYESIGGGARSSARPCMVGYVDN